MDGSVVLVLSAAISYFLTFDLLLDGHVALHVADF